MKTNCWKVIKESVNKEVSLSKKDLNQEETDCSDITAEPDKE